MCKFDGIHVFFFLDANGPTIVTTIVPLGSGPTHTICPQCHSEIDTATKTEPGMIAYISGVVIALLGYAVITNPDTLPVAILWKLSVIEIFVEPQKKM